MSSCIRVRAIRVLLTLRLLLIHLISEIHRAFVECTITSLNHKLLECESTAEAVEITALTFGFRCCAIAFVLVEATRISQYILSLLLL